MESKFKLFCKRDNYAKKKKRQYQLFLEADILTDTELAYVWRWFWKYYWCDMDGLTRTDLLLKMSDKDLIMVRKGDPWKYAPEQLKTIIMARINHDKLNVEEENQNNREDGL